MSKIYDPSHPPLMIASDQCVGCQIAQGKFKYGIHLCDECDERVFVKPYGKPPDPKQHVTSISLRVPNPPLKYKEMEVIYRFSKWDTLIVAQIVRDRLIHSFTLLVLPGIQPMTPHFLQKVSDNIEVWLTFS